MMRKLLPILCTFLTLAACQPPRIDTGRIAADFPLVDGSTSAHPLQRLAACEILDVSCQWTEPNLLFNMEQTIITEASGAAAETVMAINPSGTNGAYLNLIEGAADVILVARAPSDDELAAAGAAGITLDVVPVALDAFVFIVHVDNPLESLTVDELKSIYTGDLTAWSEVGLSYEVDGEGLIHAYQRDQNSGSQELMEDLIMQGAPMIDAPEMITLTMLGPFNAIGGDPSLDDGDRLGLGYTIYYYATMMLPHEFVKMIAIDGIAPTSETIANRSYPLTTEVYAVVRGDDPSDSPAKLFRAWLLSAEGQQVVRDSGYIPLNPSSAP